MAVFRKNRVVMALVAPFFLSVLSCNDVIFDEIKKEVELEEPDISGSINSIVRFKNYIYTQNGNVWRKPYSTEISNDNMKAHGWKKMRKPSANADYKFVNKIAADKDNIYVQMTLIDEDADEGENITKGSCIYSSTDGMNWTEISINGTTIFPKGSVSLFCTNSSIPNERNAYLKYYDSDANTYTVYKLNSTSGTGVSTTQSTSSTPSTTPYTNSTYCASFNGNTYFSSTPIVANDYESYTLDGTQVNGEPATVLYYSSGDVIYWSTNGTFSNDNKVDLDCGAIYSMAATKNFLYLGTSKGIERVSLDSTGKPSDFVSEGLKNARSTLSTYYNVNSVLVLYPALDDSKNIIYGTTDFKGSTSSTSATQRNRGLWSYIPTRGSWNRE